MDHLFFSFKILSLDYISPLFFYVCIYLKHQHQQFFIMPDRASEVAALAASRIIENEEIPLHPHGCGGAHLLTYNKKWAAAIREKDPSYFEKLSSGQSPEFFFIGCCDSRVVPTEMLGLLPGEAFVHRSIAGLIAPKDLNVLAAAQYAVHHLHVHTIIVAGHHRCGGISAAYQEGKLGYAEEYLDELGRLRDMYKDRVEEEVRGELQEKLDAFAEISVIHQAMNLAKSPIMQTMWQKELEHEAEYKEHMTSPSRGRREAENRRQQARSPSLGPLGGAREGSPVSSPTTRAKEDYQMKFGSRPSKVKVQRVEIVGWVLVLPNGVVRDLIKLNGKSDIEEEGKKAIETVFTRYARPPHVHVVDDGTGREVVVGSPRELSSAEKSPEMSSPQLFTSMDPASS